MVRPRRFAGSLVALTSVAVAAGGCGSEDAADVAVTVDEWSIEATPTSTEGGTITLDVDHEGTTDHELVLVAVPADGDGSLPTLPSGELDLSALPPVDRIPAFGEGRFEASFLRVLPGRYVLVCNLVGEDGRSHYAAGMAAALEVSADDRDEPVVTTTIPGEE